jgi:hypothetical protein
MKGRVSLPNLKSKDDAGQLDESDKTFLALLESVDVDLSDFEEVDFEALTVNLRARLMASPRMCSSSGVRTPACAS